MQSKKFIFVVLAFVAGLAGLWYYKKNIISSKQIEESGKNTILPAEESEESGKNLNPWARMALKDLKGIFDIISKNHPGLLDEQNPDFSKWLNTGYEEARLKAKKAQSYRGYLAAQRFFVNGFKDGHVTFSPLLYERESSEFDKIFNRKWPKTKWPGWTIAKKSQKYIVHHRETDLKDSIQKGWELISCDGKSPEDLMRANVFPFFGIEALPSSWTKYAPYLFVDRENPFVALPKNCLFETDKGSKEIQLKWRRANLSDINKHIKNPQFREFPNPTSALTPKDIKNPQFKEFPNTYSRKDGLIWISLSLFDIVPGSKPEEELKAIIRKLPEARSKDIVVFDVRRLPGGNSLWGEKIMDSFYGKDFSQAVLKEISKDQFIEWRVSDGNIEHLGYLIAYFEKTSQKAMNYFKLLKKEMETAPRDKLYNAGAIAKLFSSKEKERSKETEKGEHKNPVKAQVFFLSDGTCASACLDFADHLLAMPGVIHVGAPTYGDTVYMEIRFKALPSGLGTLAFPMKVHRNRKRGHNEFYTPSHLWMGEFDDTEGLRQWIKELAKKLR